ncbi:MAG: rRNA maturation RNase YbeY [Nitrospirota bacterium]
MAKVSISNRQRKIKLDRKRLETDSLKALSLLGLQRTELSVLLAGPERVRQLNRTYRGRDHATDVLSFPLHDLSRGFPVEGEVLLGDVVINPVRAEEQAREQGVALEEELRRLLVHGLLHLLGYEHEASPEQARRMRRKERDLLRKLRQP